MFDRVNDFPFKSVLSFSGLIDFWRQLLSKDDGVGNTIIKAVEKELENAPELFKPIDDLQVLEKNRNLIDMLMGLVFPPAFSDQDYAAAFVPFQNETVYVSPRFKRLWPSESCMDFGNLANLDAEHWAMGRIVKACSLILETFYDMRFPLDFPLIVTIKDPETHLDRFLNFSFDPRFVEIRKTGKLKPLSPVDREWILSAGDEVDKAEFLRKEIEPILDHLMEADPGMQEPIETYRAALEPSLGVLYRKRKDFEESIFRINEAISVYLDEEEETAQSFFPHYFEKMKTDGVDYTIYIGASMVEDLKFDMLYLKNLRLWQLMVMCGVAWRTEDLKATSKMPLEAAHLILVQDTPLSIRFRPDERRFDNVRR